jgi:hypothetical protein
LPRAAPWGSIFRVDMLDALNGTIAIVVLGDKDHSSFDNLAFADQCTLLAAEDRGDTLHDQLNTLDSVWAFDICKEGAPAKRLLALGQDAEATDEDNEPTGLHISDGEPSVRRLLGSSRHEHEQHVAVALVLHSAARCEHGLRDREVALSKSVPARPARGMGRPGRKPLSGTSGGAGWQDRV